MALATSPASVHNPATSRREELIAKRSANKSDEALHHTFPSSNCIPVDECAPVRSGAWSGSQEQAPLKTRVRILKLLLELV